MTDADPNTKMSTIAPCTILRAAKKAFTLQPLYNKVCYNMVLDITWIRDGSQKCIDYIEKMTINGHFFNIIYTFLFFGYNTVVYAIDPNNSVIRGCGVIFYLVLCTVNCLITLHYWYGTP